MDLEKLCKDFHANLKFLYWAAVQEQEKLRTKANKDEKDNEKIEELSNKMRHYQEAYKKVEILQERRHLTLIGEKGGYREAYQKMLKIIENKYIPEGQYTSPEVMGSILNTIEGIDALCKEYGIEMNTKGNEQER